MPQADPLRRDGASLRIGCSSWTSEAWWGRLYPPQLKDGDRLAHYARLYDAVEVDSSYYRDPGPILLRRWARVTPPDFLFALKFPRDLLDPKHPADPEPVTRFLANARLLGPKLGPILLQFPPWAKPALTSGFLDRLLDRLDPQLRYSVELRSPEWFEGETWQAIRARLEGQRIALTWSYLTYLDVPPELTTDFVYLRFIGDHTTVPEPAHGEVRVDRSRELARWAHRLRDAQARTVQQFVFFNNHFQGFAPDSVNLFRAALGLPSIEYAHRSGQQTL